MKNIKISQENPERFKNPRFYYTYVDEQGKRHKKLCQEKKKKNEEAQNYIRNTKIIIEWPYLISNIAKDMYIKNGTHLKRLADFGKTLCDLTIKQKRYMIELIISQFGIWNIFDIKFFYI